MEKKEISTLLHRTLCGRILSDTVTGSAGIYHGDERRIVKEYEAAKIDAKYFFLFSAKGFSEEIRQLAEEDTRYILVDMNEL